MMLCCDTFIETLPSVNRICELFCGLTIYHYIDVLWHSGFVFVYLWYLQVVRQSNQFKLICYRRVYLLIEFTLSFQKFAMIVPGSSIIFIHRRRLV